jgi:hypothetical protein
VVFLLFFFSFSLLLPLPYRNMFAKQILALSTIVAMVSASRKVIAAASSSVPAAASRYFIDFLTAS